MLLMVPVVMVLLGAGLTAYSGASKASDITRFRSTLVSHGFVAESASAAVAWAVAAVELASGGLAIFLSCVHRTRWRAAVLLMSVFVALAVYTTVLSIRPPARPAGCGCGWSKRVVDDWKPIAIQNWAVASVLGVCALSMRRRWVSENSDARL